MVNAIKWESNPSITAYLTTELNSLANAAKVLGAAIDNSAALDMYMDLQLYVAEQGGARSAGARVDVYLVTAIDGGTNYGWGDATDTPPGECLVWSFSLDAAVTARYCVSRPFPIGPGHHKLVIVNNTGQAFAAADNTVGYRLLSEEIQ
jgi:hypothetical protein